VSYRAPRVVFEQDLAMHTSQSSVIRLAVTAALLSTGCTQQREAGGLRDIYERTTHQLSQVPESAAGCVARNATSAKYAPSIQPLYGTVAMAVSVHTIAAGGDLLAIVQLLPADLGSIATITAARDALPDFKRFSEMLITGC
jgi:hypothetical protein